MHRSSTALVAACALIAAPVLAGAQSRTSCRLVCAPTVVAQFGVVRTHIASAPRVRSLTTGAVKRLAPHTSELVALVMTAPLAVPHLGLLAAVSWLPTAKTSANPFTEYTASELGDQSIRANAPVVTMGVTGSLLSMPQLQGWAALGVNVADQYGPAARPHDRSTYTHKLDLQAVLTLAPFNSVVAPKTYLHGVDIVSVLDYVATGLPRAGDEVPAGERVFVDDAHSVSLSVVASFPLAVATP